MKQHKLQDYFFKPISYYRFLYLVYLCLVSLFSLGILGGFFRQLLAPYGQIHLSINISSFILLIITILVFVYMMSAVISMFGIVVISGFVLPKYLPQNFWGITKIFIYPILPAIIQWLVLGFSLLNYFVYVGVTLYLSIMLPILIINWRSKRPDLPKYTQAILVYLIVAVFTGALGYFFSLIILENKVNIIYYLFFLIVFGINLYESTRISYKMIKNHY